MNFQKGHPVTLLDELQVQQIIKVSINNTFFKVSWIQNLLLQFQFFSIDSGFTAAMYEWIIVLSRKSNSGWVDVDPAVTDGTSLSEVLPSAKRRNKAKKKKHKEKSTKVLCGKKILWKYKGCSFPSPPATRWSRLLWLALYNSEHKTHVCHESFHHFQTRISFFFF